MPSEALRPALVALHIGERLTHVMRTGAGHEDEPTEVLQVGFLAPGASLSHSPPTASELEHAIAAVEDVVMPLASTIPRGAELTTSDSMARRLASLGPDANATREMLGIDAVESLFDDMAAVALGRPSAASPFLDSALCGYLLILREFMHHLGFARVLLRPGA